MKGITYATNFLLNLKCSNMIKKLNDLRKSKLVSYCMQGVIVKVLTSPLIIHT